MLAAVSLTGIAWFVYHDLWESEPDDLQRLLLASHGVFAYGAVLVFGSALPTHAWLAWRHRRKIASGASMIVTIASGLSMIATIGTLALTGLLLYYAGEESRVLARWVHIAVGLGAFVAIPIHITLGRRIRQASARQVVKRALAERPMAAAHRGSPHHQVT